MATQKLREREPIAVDDYTRELNLELADKAGRLLGYAKLKRTLAAGKVSGELARVLKCWTYNRSPLGIACRRPGIFQTTSEAREILLWTIPLWGVLSMIGIAAGGLISWQLAVASLASILLLLAKGCQFDDRLAALFPTCERVPFSKYPEDVPLHVLEKAVAIKKQLPGAQFYVQQRAKDPFLIVKCDEEECYVELWQEPRFDGHARSPWESTDFA